MILRPRQEQFVARSLEALKEHGNTVGVAPTGAGKTVMLAAVAGNYPSALIVQHRGELVDQNLKTFRKVNSSHKVDVFNAERKKFLDRGATFAMVQTLMRDRNLARMKPVDLITIDEAHHAAAAGYQAVIHQAKQLNPDVKIFGVTATPTRGDKKPLKSIFSNVADVITLPELIASGHLVKPRTFVIDCGLKAEIDQARDDAKKKRLSDFDMTQVEAIMDKQAVTDRVIAEWKKTAGDRRTIVFCSTLKHCEDVMRQFNISGIRAGMVWGDMPDAQRREMLLKLDTGEIQVVVNVAVLTEGFDSQPVSCIVLLRPCSYKSTMMQMIGRGLRRVDQERYPGIIKDDCVVLDFGYSLITHGDLNIEVDLDPEKTFRKINCPECDGIILASSLECPLCGALINIDDEEDLEEEEVLDGVPIPKGALVNFLMTEVDLLSTSPFRWEEFFSGMVMIANGLTAWAMCLCFRGRWYALGGKQNELGKMIGNCPTRFDTLAVADDFLREAGDTTAAKKTKQWLGFPPTEKQLQVLGLDNNMMFSMSRYRASCQITWKFEEKKVRRLLETQISPNNLLTM